MRVECRVRRTAVRYVAVTQNVLRVKLQILWQRRLLQSSYTNARTHAQTHAQTHTKDTQIGHEECVEMEDAEEEDLDLI